MTSFLNDTYPDCLLRSRAHQNNQNLLKTVKISVLASKVCFLEPNSSKDVRVKSFIFLNSTLISEILLRKFDRTGAKFGHRNR